MAELCLAADLRRLQDAPPDWLLAVVEHSERALEVCFAEPLPQCTLLLSPEFRAAYPDGSTSAVIDGCRVELPAGSLMHALACLRDEARCRKEQLSSGSGTDEGYSDSDGDSEELDLGPSGLEEEPANTELLGDLRRARELFGDDALSIGEHKGVDRADIFLHVPADRVAPAAEQQDRAAAGTPQLVVRLRVSRAGYRAESQCGVDCTQGGRPTVLAQRVRDVVSPWVKGRFYRACCSPSAFGDDGRAEVAGAREPTDEGETTAKKRRLVGQCVAEAEELLRNMGADHELSLALQKSMDETTALPSPRRDERAPSAEKTAQVHVSDENGFLAQLMFFLHGCLPDRSGDNEDLPEEPSAPSCDPGKEVPRHWGQSSGSGALVCVPLSASSGEFSALKASLVTYSGWIGRGRDVREPGALAECRELALDRAWRIQNPRLWSRYAVARAEVAADLTKERLTCCSVVIRQETVDALRPLPGPLHCGRGLNEVRLFHGTPSSALPGILSEGLDEGRCRRSCFGPGLYLAEDIGKADQYTDRKEAPPEAAGLLYGGRSAPGGLSYVFVCRAVLGRPAFTRDSRHLRCRDGQVHVQNCFAADGWRGELYTSILVETGGPLCRYREFVLPSGRLLYPEYLIAYRRQ